MKVVSGTSYGVESVRDLAYTPVWVLDVVVKPGGKVRQGLPVGWNAFVYVLEGNVRVGGRSVGQYCNVVFGRDGDGVEVGVDEAEEGEARFGEFPWVCVWDEC